MYLLIVYDVDVNRVNKVNKFLKMYLHWRQNSVFEGEISISQFKKLKSGLKDIANEDKDSILIYNLKDRKNFKLEVIGIEKNPIELIL
ncbi:MULTISPECIES: CRISPR-associated endonuclease Cas2 [Methanobacterium]|uniref:CRISPR-associated endoribonuclease Cas2 n=1 Tax=Methanobacterium subterraneum TaxID=59277 RepID=A0A7K4DJR1_9EURY|nr:CRISPR-associated endonuclease Cas2 [Methanobacterium sp. MZ-A1]AUB58576.1 CRISPR-associated endonuclease Cas2 [Methanobacterium sp. MZ-A1]MBW4257254.1 CRISPR-associated endonuclease Cas2 [Methanobacterium sp. YSL]NMO08578.1 CRISPR-associated endonuclease Cas2 [Methanobacterium subterraneum]PKL71028.1 MAG: CRISPR-associated endonuclease Cas2 [Methanobacteriales archaeon HGW-Methanobacteriales-2]